MLGDEISGGIQKFLIFNCLFFGLIGGCAGQAEDRDRASLRHIGIKTLTITISTAESMQKVFEDIRVLYNQKYPQAKITLNFGSSGSWQHQIEQGTPNVDANYKEFKLNLSDATRNNHTSKENNLKKILVPNTEVEKVAGGFKFTEGPVWHPDGFLLFSDIPANIIYKWQPGQETSIFRQPSGNANGNTLDKSGRLVTAEHGNRRVSLTENNGEIVTLADRYQEKQLNSPNDLVVKSDGGIYFTDPPYGIKSEQEELGFYGVYRLTPDGTLTLLVDDFLRPNGIALSPDETKLYVNDSQKGHIRVFDVNPDGELDKGKLFAELKPPSEEGAADGMKVDTKGNVYSTGPGGVWIFSPQGERLGIIETPEPAANIAWGDRDRQTLYITANTSVYRIPLRIAGMR